MPAHRGDLKVWVKNISDGSRYYNERLSAETEENAITLASEQWFNGEVSSAIPTLDDGRRMLHLYDWNLKPIGVVECL